MSEKLGKVIQKQQLFSKNDVLLVGVSGGVDSMVLCHLLHVEGFTFIMAHCNYNMRGQESELDEQLVRQWALRYNIALFVKACPLNSKLNIQQEARRLRYDFFNEVKTKENCRYILTAHHEDDQLETFMINLSRGSGLRGLNGIQKTNGNLIRPLLEVTKKHIYEYAIENKISFREDQSNQSDFYLRNYFRNEIIPRINKRIPAFHEMALRSIHHLSEVSLLVDEIFLEWKDANVIADNLGFRIIKPSFQKFYLLSIFLIDLGFHPETILQIKNNINNSGKLFADKNKHELLVDRKFIYIRKPNENSNLSSYTIEMKDGELKIENGSFKWNLKSMNGNYLDLKINKNEALLDATALKFPLILRKWQLGDMIKPFGMNGKTKKVQDVFTNSKIPLFAKENIYLLISGEDVLWIPGIIRSEIACILEGTTHYLHISWNEFMGDS